MVGAVVVFFLGLYVIEAVEWLKSLKTSKPSEHQHRQEDLFQNVLVGIIGCSLDLRTRYLYVIGVCFCWKVAWLKRLLIRISSVLFLQLKKLR